MSDDQPERRLSATRTFDRLREAYFRYYETPFRLRDVRLQDERKKLLNQDGRVFRQPLLELRPEYTLADNDLDGSVSLAGAPAELAPFAHAGLIPPGRALYKHQEQALETGLTPGRNMVITAGTGSGKTESFLLPVLASLLAESASWQGAPAKPSKWWMGNDQPFVAQRLGETGRDQAVRTIVLYPMNALVDDQLVRMRKALDSDEARGWLDQHRRGHRFYFGRYTGTTPVTGSPTNYLALRELRKYLRATEQRSARAIKASRQPEHEDDRYFVPRLDGAEMRSRWDMSAAPPDILVTNYSMLNVMLLRERDSHFFESTRAWLDQPGNRFTLVVDELHMYRGTAGTEIAYLLRALKRRLGLTDNPNKLRVLAASASLESPRDRDYLGDFFGVDPDSFDFVEGDVRRADTTRIPAPGRFASVLSRERPADAASLARDEGLSEAVRASFETDDGRTEARSIADLAARVFPDAATEESERALANLLEGFAEAPARGDPRLRAHLFFRNVPGVWACSNPACPKIPGGTYDDRTVGRLYAEPTTRCECGARVLELNYCQNCGDVFLGGFVPEGATQRAGVDAMLLADIPDLAQLPDQVRIERTAANYLCYWPRKSKTLTELDSQEWTRDGGSVTYAFRRAIFNPGSGAARQAAAGESHTGWTFHVRVKAPKGKPAHDPTSLPPFPTQCPACGDNWEVTYGQGGTRLPFNHHLRHRSPIRGMRTGFEKINQVLITELASDMVPSERKVVVFTDSRQDAAKLSAGLGLRHYQDLLRLLLYRKLAETGTSGADIELARAHVIHGQKSPASWNAIAQLRSIDQGTFNALHDVWEGAPGTSADDETVLLSQLTQQSTLDTLAGLLADELLGLGVNPGGPHARLLEQGPRRPRTRWISLYDWSGQQPRSRGGLSPQQQSLRAEIDKSLIDEMLDGLFSGAGRDFESIGLGWLALADDRFDAFTDDATIGYVRASLRILADQRRFFGLRDGQENPPRKLRRFWEAIENSGGPSTDDLQVTFLNRCGSAVRDFLIDPGKVVLRPAGADALLCDNCRRQHLNRGCGRCTYCGKELPTLTSPAERSGDYYAWKAAEGQRFRLACEELTGQTDRLAAQIRQSRFQKVFLDGDEEIPLADEVDLLSVTTTMEAGVDIGALSAVVLGNMPPTRFNYQQRVGRAGRRDSPVAVALTVCRGRSHDEYYFDRPHAIANDPTPKPYLALNRVEIFRRALCSEVLRLAMSEIGSMLRSDGAEFDETANVHGRFGRTIDWAAVKPQLASWLNENQATVHLAANNLAHRTPNSDMADQQAQACIDELVARIDAVISVPGHDDLSQRLAENGVLPMFGFPSSVRYLYTQRPTSSYPWPPPGVIDRDLAMAAAQFAPLSEVVRDRRVHPAVGIAAFEPSKTPRPVDDALGTLRIISVCRTCSFLLERPEAPAEATPCPRCGAGPDAFRTMPLREPLGFRAGEAHDFNGQFSWNPRAMAARALADLDSLAVPEKCSVNVRAGTGSRYVINDNAGKLFQLHRSKSKWGGYVSAAAVERDLVHSWEVEQDTAIDVALGAVQQTDFMFVGPTTPVHIEAGLRLNLVSVHQPSGALEPIDGRRAAWYSLAFLLRTVAASHLDIQPLELTAGVFSGMVDGLPSPYAFIADTLENGAGFSSYLGTTEVLPVLLEKIGTYLEELSNPEHANECQASCYRCLRDYGNMAYHSLLDWRLARDLFQLLLGNNLPDDQRRASAALEQWARSYGAAWLEGLTAPAARFSHPKYGEFVVIAKHPFEATETSLIAERLTEAQAEAEVQVPDASGTVFIDTFVLDRDPRRVVQLCEQVEE